MQKAALFDYSFSVAIVGDSGVGKSVLVNSEATSFFSQNVMPPERGVEVTIEDKVYQTASGPILVQYVFV